MDINLLIEPRGSESPASKKSSTSIASTSTSATRTYATAPSTYAQSPAYYSPHHTPLQYATSSPMYVATPAYSHPGPTSAASMQGGPVLPAIADLHRHPDPGPPPQFRPLYSGQPGPQPIAQGPPGANSSPPSHMLRRATSQTPQEESPAKKQSKWTPEEDNLTIELRGQGMKWDDIAKRLPGRSSISCRLRYQNYLEKRAVWDEEKKNKLARLYARYVTHKPQFHASRSYCWYNHLVTHQLFLHNVNLSGFQCDSALTMCRFKDQMWQKVATEMGIPWRSAESMHWQLGEQEMSARANAPVFQLHPSATSMGSPTPSLVAPAPIPGPMIPAPPHGFTATNAPPPHLIPHPAPSSHPQQHQPPSSGPIHYSYHQRAGSGPEGTRKRSSSFTRRRAEGRSRSSVPPQLGPTLPRINPQSEADLISGAQTAPVPESYYSIKREVEEQSGKRKREEEGSSGFTETSSASGRSPDRSSLRSGTGSVKSLKRGELNESKQRAFVEPLSYTS
jgi:hypothetical protein